MPTRVIYSWISRFMRQDHVNDNLTNIRLFIIVQNISFIAKKRPTITDTHRLYVTKLNILKIIIVSYAVVTQKRMTSLGK